MKQALLVSSFALLATIFALLLATVIFRITRSKASKKRAAFRARLRQSLVKFLEEDFNPAELAELRKIRSSELDELSDAMLTKVKGRAKDILVSFLASRGAIDKALVRTHRPGSVGRCKAALFLGNAGIPEAREPLERLLHDRNRDVRTLAATSLGKLGDPLSVEPLLAVVHDGKCDIPFGTVLLALLKIGAPGIDALRRCTSTSSIQGRAIAVEVLGLLGAVEAVEEIVGMLKTDQSQEVRIRSSRALGRIGSPKAGPALAACLGAEESTVMRIVTCGAISDLGDRKYISNLAELVSADDPRIALAAALALTRLGEKGRARLVALRDSSMSGSRYAMEALARASLRPALSS